MHFIDENDVICDQTSKGTPSIWAMSRNWIGAVVADGLQMHLSACRDCDSNRIGYEYEGNVVSPKWHDETNFLIIKGTRPLVVGVMPGLSYASMIDCTAF